MSKSKILFKMTGSIACYKACQLISKLVQNNFEVQVVATESALQFIGNATLEGLTGKPVVSDLFARGNVMDHIHLDRWADLVIVAPATAHFINRASAGIGDDLLSTLFLAHDFNKPYLIAPAMNELMYKNPITQASLGKLTQLGAHVLPTDSGNLACGEVGPGRLLDPDDIFQKIMEVLPPRNPSILPQQGSVQATADLSNGMEANGMEGQQPVRVLITAGGTIMPIDDVRFICNTSTGRTGIQIAEHLRDWGLPITLVRSVSSPNTNGMLHQLHFRTFADLAEILQQELSERYYSHIIHLAAVSDYEVASIEIGSQSTLLEEISKLPSGQEQVTLRLKPTFKIVNELRTYSLNKKLNVIAFKLTSKAHPSEQLKAVQKLIEASNAQWVVHNDLSEIDSEKGFHRFTIHGNNRFNLKQCFNTEGLAAELYQIITKGEPVL